MTEITDDRGLGDGFVFDDGSGTDCGFGIGCGSGVGSGYPSSDGNGFDISLSGGCIDDCDYEDTYDGGCGYGTGNCDFGYSDNDGYGRGSHFGYGFDNGAGYG